MRRSRAYSASKKADTPACSPVCACVCVSECVCVCVYGVHIPCQQRGMAERVAKESEHTQRLGLCSASQAQRGERGDRAPT